MTIIVGVDPDSVAHGVAIYRDKKLVELLNLALPEFTERFLNNDLDCLFCIEHVTANKAVYSQRYQKTLSAQGRVGRNVGACQQSQIELVRMIEFYKKPFILMNPRNGNWGKNKMMKERFERVTGWKKRSNSDQRSAAFFGFLCLDKKVKL
jgi:hypothetical protein